MDALLTDLYQLTMLQAYLDEGLVDRACFERAHPMNTADGNAPSLDAKLRSQPGCWQAFDADQSGRSARVKNGWSTPSMEIPDA